MESQNVVNGNEQYLKNSGTEDMNVNTSTEQSEQNFGVVTDVMIAVTINQDTAGNVGTAQLISHIARAAGIPTDQQADKINVLVAPFYNPDADTTTTTPILSGLQIPKWALYVGAGVFGLLLLLIVLLVIRAKRRKKAEALLLAQQAEELAAQEAAAAAAAEQTEEQIDNVLEIKNEKSMELKQEIRKFTEENPEIAAQMIRTWLKGEGANG